MSDSIHGDLASFARAETERMPWSPSPSGTVWRKRVHRVGPPESGQVTSVVRYEPESTFHAHDHPDGEEILVLEGVFSDEHGDWPAGAFLLNPEGFRHAPFSKPGCTLFVKLRQFPGRGRRHVALDTNTLAWEPSARRGIATRRLYAQEGFSDVIRLERFEPGAGGDVVEHAEGAELFVLDGAFADEHGEHSRGTWLRYPAGAKHHPRASAAGCVLYVKTGGLRYLRSS
jgi:anti-sigma factor ChrR (cupin superfamily)